MTNVAAYTPTHQRMKDLASKYVAGIEDQERRDYMSGWLCGRGDGYYAKLLQTHANLGQDAFPPILAELAFWRAVHDLMLMSARYAIADKLGFLPPWMDDPYEPTKGAT